MRRGEKGILLVIALIVGGTMLKNLWFVTHDKTVDRGLPFYSTMQKDEEKKAMRLISDNQCRDCHSLWGGEASFMRNVPAPRLDGIGSIRDEEWFYNYLSSKDPQSILPSRLKKEFSMPSYASLPEAERREMAKYLASLKVKDWYLTETRKAEYEKLTGNTYKP